MDLVNWLPESISFLQFLVFFVCYLFKFESINRYLVIFSSQKTYLNLRARISAMQYRKSLPSDFCQNLWELKSIFHKNVLKFFLCFGKTKPITSKLLREKRPLFLNQHPFLKVFGKWLDCKKSHISTSLDHSSRSKLKVDLKLTCVVFAEFFWPHLFLSHATFFKVFLGYVQK